MIDGKRVLAIVPARAGSKRVLNKNTKIICHKPLISWTFESIKEAKYIDSVFVSTDSQEVQKISEDYGFPKRSLRPNNLANDYATTVDVVIHTLGQVHEEYDILILLQPTSPLRTSADIERALELYVEKKSRSVVSVCELEGHPSWSSSLDKDMSLDKLRQNLSIKRSQDLEKYYRLNGAIYIVDVKSFLAEKTFFTNSDSYAYIMPKINSIDIDTEEDFFMADSLMKGMAL